MGRDEERELQKLKSSQKSVVVTAVGGAGGNGGPNGARGGRGGDAYASGELTINIDSSDNVGGNPVSKTNPMVVGSNDNELENIGKAVGAVANILGGILGL